MKKEQKYFNKLWKEMQQHFKHFVHSQDQEDLHQFRVQVKKIRSFLTLLEEDKKNSGLLHIFKPIKKIFKSAGIVRDAYLYQEQAKGHNIQQAQFYAAQQAAQNEETHKLLNKSKKHFRTIKKVKGKLQHLRPISGEAIKHFYTKELNRTQQLLAQNDFSEKLHDGRKMLKHLMYNEQAVKKSVAKELAINFDYIDELQHLLGQWHDNKLALAFFDDKLDEKELLSMKIKGEELQVSITERANNFEEKIKARQFVPSNAAMA